MYSVHDIGNDECFVFLCFPPARSFSCPPKIQRKGWKAEILILQGSQARRTRRKFDGTFGPPLQYDVHVHYTQEARWHTYPCRGPDDYHHFSSCACRSVCSCWRGVERDCVMVLTSRVASLSPVGNDSGQASQAEQTSSAWRKPASHRLARVPAGPSSNGNGQIHTVHAHGQKCFLRFQQKKGSRLELGILVLRFHTRTQASLIAPFSISVLCVH